MGAGGNERARSTFVFCLFFCLSIPAFSLYRVDYGGVHFDQLRRDGGTLQAPLCPPPRPEHAVHTRPPLQVHLPNPDPPREARGAMQAPAVVSCIYARLDPPDQPVRRERVIGMEGLAGNQGGTNGSSPLRPRIPRIYATPPLPPRRLRITRGRTSAMQSRRRTFREAGRAHRLLRQDGGLAPSRPNKRQYPPLPSDCACAPPSMPVGERLAAS